MQNRNGQNDCKGVLLAAEHFRVVNHKKQRKNDICGRIELNGAKVLRKQHRNQTLSEDDQSYKNTHRLTKKNRFAL